MGFDFHITPAGPKLIEVNTNAGGAFLNIAAHDAQRACCPVVDDYLAAQPSAAQLEAEIVAMFRREWSLARGAAPLRTIAIVDVEPRGQFLYPEFQLAQKLFESHGIRAHIADPSELELADDCIRLRGERNRSRLQPSDRLLFRRADQSCLAARLPARSGSHHSASARSRSVCRQAQLALLSNAAALEALGVPQDAAEVLVSGIPSTREAVAAQKPGGAIAKSGSSSREAAMAVAGRTAATSSLRRVFAEVVKGGYIAQVLTPPSERWRSTATGKEVFKVDVRCYVYAGKIQLMAARLYQGQTTNFRTAGGGFAPIYIIGRDGEGNAKMEACA